MSPMIRLFALFGSLTLAACQMAPWKEPPSHSRILPTHACGSERICTVNVDYEVDRKDCDAPYCYPVAPVHVIVPAPKAGDRQRITMVWTLPADSPASFTENGIVFSDAKSGFDCPRGSPDSAKTFTCTNERNHSSNPDPEAEEGWKYSIRLKLNNGGKLKVLDPWVVNR